jgi:hypothetical protein
MCVGWLVNFIVIALQVREADISRLSFAVEIAEEFYGRFVIFFSLSFFISICSTNFSHHLFGICAAWC